MAAYLGLAIGDALGATVEFMTPNEIRHQIGLHCEITGGGWLRLKAGKVTDDTTMSLALGESIIARGHVDAKAAAEAFDAWMRAKPVDIGNTVRRKPCPGARHAPQYAIRCSLRDADPHGSGLSRRARRRRG